MRLKELFLSGIGKLILLLIFVITPQSYATRTLTADKDTVFLLKPGTSGMQVAKGNVKIKAYGGKIIRDEDGSSYLYFGDSANNKLHIIDQGSINFKNGATLEAWVYFEKLPEKPANFALKCGSFDYHITPQGKFNCAWMTFHRDKIFTTKPKQYKYFPVASEGFGGIMNIPVKQWVHLAFTYDPKSKTIRSWIDRGVDRTREMTREGAQPLNNNPKMNLEMFRNIKNCRIGEIRLSNAPRELSQLPLMNVYVNQLPWQDKIKVTFDAIKSDAKLPLEAVVILEKPSGASNTVLRRKLNTVQTQSFDIPMPSWHRAMYTMLVRVYAQNKQVFSRTVLLSCPSAGRYHKINADKSLSFKGKKFFPRMLYGVFAEDFKLVSDIGFNIVGPREYKMRFYGFGGDTDSDITDMKDCIKKANDAGLKVSLGANSVFRHLRRIDHLKNSPGLGFWYNADEPWVTLKKVQESYNSIKLLDPEIPVLGCQNNTSRMKETAEGVDILLCDPYPVPDVSLRQVCTATKAAIAGTFNSKPVFTILPCYGPHKIPTLRELRCMVYLAVISGTNGIGIYAWDERRKKTTGYYTKNHPEVLNNLRVMLSELKKLEPILTTPNSGDKIEFKPALKCLHAAVKTSNGKKYLFIANDSRKGAKITIKYPESTAQKGIFICGNDNMKNIDIVNGEAKLDIPAHGAVLFELR